MSDFANVLIAWQRRHGRHDLPWQNTRDPYRVWLSEIMLQQTQVDTVIPYYRRFLDRFPELASLAAAPLDEVLGLWSGLGYYARARNLHRAAQLIITRHAGAFPDRAETIAALPGVGRSTAAAIAAFCFGERAAILDGNVKRVFARHFGIEGFPGARAVELRMWTLADALLPEADNAAYTQALMDLGATVCTRSKPRCEACPLAASCSARAAGRQDALPTPRPRRVQPERHVRVLLAHAGGAVLLERRPEAGIWGGLYALPEIPEALTAEAFAQTLGLAAQGPAQRMAELRHTFTHFRLNLAPLAIEVGASALDDPRWRWAAAADWPGLGLPTPIRKLLLRLEAPGARVGAGTRG